MGTFWRKFPQAYFAWIHRYLPRRRHPHTLPLAKFKAQFFARPEHQWIKDDPHVFRLIDYWWDVFPTALRAQLPPNLILALVSGQLACTVAASQATQVVLLFPDLLKIWHTAAPERGLAGLGHELAHLILKHSERKISPWAAQLEADQLVVVMGWGAALQEVIADYAPPWQAQIRLAKIAAALPNTMAAQNFHQREAQGQAAARAVTPPF